MLLLLPQEWICSQALSCVSTNGKHSLFDVVRASVQRVRISSMLNALEKCTPQHHKLKFVGTRQAPAEN